MGAQEDFSIAGGFEGVADEVGEDLAEFAGEAEQGLFVAKAGDDLDGGVLEGGPAEGEGGLDEGGEFDFATRAPPPLPSNNIANVNTPGYSREQVNLSSNPPIQVGGLLFGDGVSLEPTNEHPRQSTATAGRSGKSIGGSTQRLFSDRWTRYRLPSTEHQAPGCRLR